MNPLKWWARRSRIKAAQRLLGNQGRFYYLMDYRKEYEELLDRVESKDRLLAELYLFRFWLTQCSYRLCKPDGMTDEAILSSVISTGMSLGRAFFQRMAHLDIEVELEGEFAELMQARFEEYDNAVIAHRSRADPLGLESASKSLAEQVLENPSARTTQYLAAKSKSQFNEIAAEWRDLIG